MTTLMQASHQWMSRPNDQRFTSLIELAAATKAARDTSKAIVISSRSIEARPVEGDHRGLVVVGPNGAPVAPTHWSFGQLAKMADAPAGYMRDLPAELAADCINYGLARRDIEDIGVLLRKPEATEGSPAMALMAALTGPNYGRIWNHAIADKLIALFGDGVTGTWKVPGEFGKDVVVTKDNTTLFASDRDMFVFLADEKNRIEMKGRRPGLMGSLARGFFAWNSEVGAKSFGVGTFLFDYACSNRIVWGAEGYEEINIRHTASAPDKFLEEVAPALQSLSTASTTGITTALQAARDKRLGDTDAVDQFLLKRFTRAQTQAIKVVHMNEEARPIETLWDAVTGATAYAKQIQHQDARVELERKAGDILTLAAKSA